MCRECREEWADGNAVGQQADEAVEQGVVVGGGGRGRQRQRVSVGSSPSRLDMCVCVCVCM